MNNPLFHRFIRGVASTSIGSSVQLVCGLSGVMVAVRLVPKEEFGSFVLVGVVASAFVILSSLLLQAMSVTKFIASSEELLKKEIANSSMSFTLFISIGIVIIILLSRPVISYTMKSTALSGFFLYIPVFYILTIFDQLLQKMQQGFHRYKNLALSQAINAITKLVFIILFLPVLGFGLTGLFYSVIISYMVSLLYQFLTLPVKKEFRFNFDILRQMFKFGFPLGLNSAMMFILTRLDRLMLGALAGAAGVAGYDVASRIPDNVRNFYNSFESVFFPNMAELYANKHIRELEAVLNNSLRFTGFLTSFASLILTLFQKEIVVLLFSERYLNSAAALSTLMIAMGLAIAGTVLGTSLVAMGQSDKPVKINLLGTVITIVGNFIMIPIFGFMGAAYTVLLACFLTLPINFFFLRKSDIGVNASAYLKPFGTFVLCATVYWITHTDRLILKLFLILLFLVICNAVSTITRSDISSVGKEIFRLVVKSSKQA